jgi:hypothetical protein
MTAGFNTVIRTCAALAICVAAVSVSADAQGIGVKPKASGANTTAEKAYEKGDLPSPPSRIVIPGVKSATYAEHPEIPDEAEKFGPPEEIPDSPDETDGPTFFGEDVFGRFVWVLDRSGSMNNMGPNDLPVPGGMGGITGEPNKWQIVKAEATEAIQKLDDDDWFAIVTFGH